MKSLLLLLAPCVLFAGDPVLSFERGPLRVVVSSDDSSRPNVQDSGFILMSCRTAKPETVAFTFTVNYSLDGKIGSLQAQVPRLADGLLLPPSAVPLIADQPWTWFRFFLPRGAKLKSVAVEERTEAAAFEVPAAS